MSDEVNEKPKKTALVAVVSAIFVSLILVTLGYIAYANSDISKEITKPEVEDNLAELDGQNELPPLTKPVDGKEIQDKIDELSEDIENGKDTQNKLDTQSISDEELGL